MAIRGAFALGDREDLRALLIGAGFSTVHIRIDSQMIRYPSLEEFVPGYLSATPVAVVAASLAESSRAAILQEIKTTLKPYIDDDGLAEIDRVDIDDVIQTDVDALVGATST